MAKIDELTSAIALLVVNNKKGVVDFLRSQGINVSHNAEEKDISVVLFQALADSKFANSFSKWASKKSDYSNFMNPHDTFSVNGVRYTQAEWNAYKKARGKKPKNFSGNYSNVIDDPYDINNLIKKDPKLKEDGSKVGNALRSFDWIGGINAGLSWWQTSEKAKADRKASELEYKTAQAKIDAQIQSGQISLQLGQQQLDALKIQSQAPASKTVLYIVGGAVAVGLLATIGYVLVKRKRR